MYVYWKKENVFFNTHGSMSVMSYTMVHRGVVFWSKNVQILKQKLYFWANSVYSKSQFQRTYSANFEF